MATNRNTVLLLDDHPTFRRGLRRVIEEDGHFTVVAETALGYEALHLADIHRPRIIVSDVQLPGVTGLKIARILKKQHPQTDIIMCSMDANDDRVFEALRVGASAFVRKDADAGELIDSLNRVAAGERPIEMLVMSRPALAWRILNELATRASDDGPRSTRRASSHPHNFSAREVEVLDCIAHGMANTEIATTLYITEQTVKNHITGLLRKIGVDDRTQAVMFAVSNGWVDYGPSRDASPPSTE